MKVFLQSPLAVLFLTLALYEIFFLVFNKFDRVAWLAPVAWTIGALIAVLQLSQISYATYFDGVKFLHFLLGPATVALAVPLYENRAKLFEQWRPIGAAIFVGSLTGITSAFFLARALGASSAVALSLAPKSVTTPIAMALSEKIGGTPSLTSAIVVVTVLFGAIVLISLFRWCGIGSAMSRGLALGISAHGFGTARAF